jgi:hypothetical protein
MNMKQFCVLYILIYVMSNSSYAYGANPESRDVSLSLNVGRLEAYRLGWPAQSWMSFSPV